MSNGDALPDLLSSLQDTLKLQSTLLAKAEQRGIQMQTAFDQRMRAFQDEVSQLHRRIETVVGGAGERIAKEARDAVTPVAVEYGHAVSAASIQLHRAGRTAWIWLAIVGTTLLLVLLAGWMVLGYYRRELASTRDELQRYDDAIPIVRAFYASDAIVCDGRVCVSIDPNGRRHGDKRQYRPAKPRSQP